MLTPTTKDKVHDRPVSKQEIIDLGLMSESDFDVAAKMSLELFSYGQKVAKENGLILVDTKYEIGRGTDGTIKLVDEIHTPDSSRYWINKSYETRMSAGEEPQNIDKEFLRLWFVDHCDPYSDAELPPAPTDLVIELSSRYIYLYETITGEQFTLPPDGETILDRIVSNLEEYL